MSKYIIFLPFIIFTGCSTHFFRSTQGVCTNVGISIPSSSEFGLQIAQYLSGSSLVVNSPAKITYSWKIAETNNYFWAIETTSSRMGTISVIP